MDSKKQRLEGFSDGVMAIAITLLALEIKVPILISSDIVGSLHELIPLLPTIITFVISFLAIAIFWVNHHQLTQHLQIMGKRIVWANMLFLLFQTLIPFATRVLAENPSNALSIMTYSAILFGGSVSFTAVRYFIHQKNQLPRKLVRHSLIGPIFYGLAIIVAPFYLNASYLFLVIPLIYYFLPRSNNVENINTLS